MSNADLSNSDPSLLVKDVEGMMEQLSKQIPPPEGGRLRGEVLGTFSAGRGVRLRGAGRATVEVRVEQPLQAERGDLVEVSGVPELVAEAAPVGLRVVWRGGTATNTGVSERFRERRANVEDCAARLPFTTPRISTWLRSGGRVRVVTERASKAWEEVAEAARQYRWFKPDAHYCADMREPAAIAAVLESLLEVVNPSDVVLVASGGGESADLDVFEHPRVVSALASLTERCPTILAVGHSGDELMTNKVVTYPIEAAAGAVQLIVRESRERPSEELSGAQAPVDAEDRSSAPPEPVAAAGRPSGGPNGAGMLLGAAVLGASVYLGWWARGFFQPADGVQQVQQAVLPTPR
ncbi:MAG: exodeoxyribonuclease VII large subunit [Deltaproteobacteria bacterium]